MHDDIRLPSKRVYGVLTQNGECRPLIYFGVKFSVWRKFDNPKNRTIPRWPQNKGAHARVGVFVILCRDGRGLPKICNAVFWHTNGQNLSRGFGFQNYRITITIVAGYDSTYSSKLGNYFFRRDVRHYAPALDEKL
jgi:hypothetical protein